MGGKGGVGSSPRAGLVGRDGQVSGGGDCVHGRGCVRQVASAWRGGRASAPLTPAPDGCEVEEDGDVDSDTCRPPGFKPGLPPALRRRRTVVRTFASRAQRRPVLLKEVAGTGLTWRETCEMERANARAGLLSRAWARAIQCRRANTVRPQPRLPGSAGSETTAVSAVRASGMVAWVGRRPGGPANAAPGTSAALAASDASLAAWWPLYSRHTSIFSLACRPCGSCRLGLGLGPAVARKLVSVRCVRLDKNTPRLGRSVLSQTLRRCA